MKTLRFPSFLDLLGERPYDPPCDGVELRGNQLSRDLDGSAHGLAGVVFADVRGLPRGAPASDSGLQAAHVELLGLKSCHVRLEYVDAVVDVGGLRMSYYK